MRRSTRVPWPPPSSTAGQWRPDASLTASAPAGAWLPVVPGKLKSPDLHAGPAAWNEDKTWKYFAAGLAIGVELARCPHSDADQVVLHPRQTRAQAAPR